MKIEMAGFFADIEQLLHFLARENTVPVKAPPWADHPFLLRRNAKKERNLPGRHMIGKETTPVIIERLGIHDNQSCERVRERIKQIRHCLGYK